MGNTHPTRRELLGDDFDAQALDIVPLLDGLSVGQAIAVLKRAGELVQATTTVDARSPLLSQERSALQAQIDARDAAS